MTIEQERIIKLERIRGLLSRLSLDGIYLKRQDNFAWLTCGGINYVGLGDMGNCGLLVTQEGQFAITNFIEVARMKNEEQLEAMGFSISAGAWYDNHFEANTIAKLVPGGKLGFDHGNPAGNNVAEEVKLLRFSLTESEVERYKEGGFLTARAMEETLAEAHPGDSEHQLVGNLTRRIRSLGMDVVSAMCAGDERISLYRHPVPTERPIQQRVQLGGNMRYRGLIICCNRTRSFVPLSAQLAKQYRQNVEIDCTLMAHSLPGKSFVSALEAGKAKYDALGQGEEFEKHHQGGPIGYQGRDYRVDFNTPGLIQENQAFCWNPTITGTKSEDTVIATSNGIIPVSRPILFPTITVEVCGQSFIRPTIWEA